MGQIATNSMKGVMIADVVHAEPLNGLELILVLRDASQSYSQAVVKLGVRDTDVRAIGL